MLKNYDYSPLHYRLMHAMLQPALEMEWASEAGVRRVYPSPQSSLVTWPRFVRLGNVTAWGGYVTTWNDSLCGAKTAGLISKCKPCSPGRKVAHWSNDHWAGEFGMRTHHGGRCRDGHSYQVGVISIPPTNFTAIDEYVNMWTRSETCWATHWWS